MGEEGDRRKQMEMKKEGIRQSKGRCLSRLMIHDSQPIEFDKFLSSWLSRVGGELWELGGCGWEQKCHNENGAAAKSGPGNLFCISGKSGHINIDLPSSFLLPASILFFLPPHGSELYADEGADTGGSNQIGLKKRVRQSMKDLGRETGGDKGRPRGACGV